MSKSTVPHARQITAQEGKATGRAHVRHRIPATDQSQLVKYFTALAEHAQLPVDIVAASNMTCHSPAHVLEGAGDNRQRFLASIASFWLNHRYGLTWAVAPDVSIGQVHNLIQQAVIHDWTWADVVADVIKFEQKPRNSCVEVTVKTKNGGGNPGDNMRLLTSIDNTGYRNTILQDCFIVEAVHHFYQGATLEDYLTSAREAWKQAQIKEHVSLPLMNKKGGNRKQYVEHVDLYSKWYEYHYVQRKPTYLFIDAVTRGDIRIKGWASVPTVSAITQRLKDARRWLTPRSNGKYDSLEMLLSCVTLKDQNTLELITPDDQFRLFLTVGAPSIEPPSLAEAS